MFSNRATSPRQCRSAKSTYASSTSSAPGKEAASFATSSGSTNVPVERSGSRGRWRPDGPRADLRRGTAYSPRTRARRRTARPPAGRARGRASRPLRRREEPARRDEGACRDRENVVAAVPGEHHGRSHAGQHLCTRGPEASAIGGGYRRRASAGNSRIARITSGLGGYGFSFVLSLMTGVPVWAAPRACTPPSRGRSVGRTSPWQPSLAARDRTAVLASPTARWKPQPSQNAAPYKIKVIGAEPTRLRDFYILSGSGAGPQRSGLSSLFVVLNLGSPPSTSGRTASRTHARVRCSTPFCSASTPSRPSGTPSMYPAGRAANIIVWCEAFTGLLLTALITLPTGWGL